jgi:hypothetical protein
MRADQEERYKSRPHLDSSRYLRLDSRYMDKGDRVDICNS